MSCETRIGLLWFATLVRCIRTAVAIVKLAGYMPLTPDRFDYEMSSGTIVVVFTRAVWLLMTSRVAVFDTSTARNLAHADTLPGWVGTFAAMLGSDYSFSLADGALVIELLVQRSREVFQIRVSNR